MKKKFIICCIEQTEENHLAYSFVYNLGDKDVWWTQTAISAKEFDSHEEAESFIAKHISGVKRIEIKPIYNT